MPLALLLLLASFPSAVGLYSGGWKLVPSDSDNIPAAVDRVVSKLNFLIRGIARTRLQRTQVAFPTIDIAAGDVVRIRHTGGTDVPHRSPDTPVQAVAPDGRNITVRLLPGPPLREVYESAEGRRENTYVLSNDGSRLTLDVMVSSPRLPQPLRYRLAYVRIR